MGGNFDVSLSPYCNLTFDDIVDVPILRLEIIFLFSIVNFVLE